MLCCVLLMLILLLQLRSHFLYFSFSFLFYLFSLFLDCHLCLYESISMNPWLTYGEPLHRLREFGVTAKEFDLIDESKLSIEQMKKLCSVL